MNILMLNPPFFKKYSKSSRSPAVTKSGTIYYPLWLAYASGVLDQRGYTVQLIDAPAKCLEDEMVLKMAKEFQPALTVIDTSTPSIESDLSFAKLLKLALPTCKICLVGTHASACVEEILSQHASTVDFIARHEYDYTLPELAESLTDTEKLRTVKGISYMENGILVETPDREYITDLDALPFVSEVYKKYLDIHDYFYAHVSYPTISIFSSRGCPSRCFYCMYSQVMFGKHYRKRSAKNLFDECVYITKTFPVVKEILIDDDNFAVDQQNVKEFCHLMIDNHIKLKWVVQVRVTLEYETMLLMKQAGCKLLVAGFESGNQEILNNMHKGIQVEQSRRFSKDAKRAKLRVHGCFMVGNPGETRQTMKETLALALSMHLDTVQFYPLIVYPGTEAYAWAKTNGYIQAEHYSDWLLSDGEHNCVLSTPQLSSQELVDFCNYARKKFYLRPKYMAYKGLQCLTSKEDLVRTMKSFNIFKKYLFRRTHA